MTDSRVPTLASIRSKDYNPSHADLSHGFYHLTEEYCRC